MKSNYLSKRMEAVVEMVSPQSFTIADVGCDHAYVSIALIEREIAKKVIAMDVRKGPLDIARRNVNNAGYEGQIELRLGDGLEQLLPQEADTIIIAGMGGLLIKSILETGLNIISNECEENDSFHRPELVLQPQSDLKEVRIFLYHHAYHIVQEQMVLDEGKYYTIIKAIPCSKEQAKVEFENFSESDWLYGQYNLKQKDTVLLEYLKKQQNTLENIRITLERQIENTPSKKTIERQITLEKELYVNRMALDCYKK